MNIIPKLLFLSLILVNIAQADNNQGTNKNLKDLIKAHNEKREAYNHNATRTIVQQEALKNEIIKETNELIEPLLNEYNNIKYQTNATEPELRNYQNKVRHWIYFNDLTKATIKCYENNQCDEFYALERKLFDSYQGKALKAGIMMLYIHISRKQFFGKLLLACIIQNPSATT